MPEKDVIYNNKAMLIRKNYLADVAFIKKFHEFDRTILNCFLDHITPIIYELTTMTGKD